MCLLVPVRLSRGPRAWMGFWHVWTLRQLINSLQPFSAGEQRERWHVQGEVDNKVWLGSKMILHLCSSDVCLHNQSACVLLFSPHFPQNLSHILCYKAKVCIDSLVLCEAVNKQSSEILDMS